MNLVMKKDVSEPLKTNVYIVMQICQKMMVFNVGVTEHGQVILALDDNKQSFIFKPFIHKLFVEYLLAFVDIIKKILNWDRLAVWF